MPVTTRKRAKRGANAVPLAAGWAITTANKAQTAVNSDESSDEGLSDAATDRDSDHSDYKSRSKKRKRASGKAPQRPAKKRVNDFSDASILSVPDLTDETYARNEKETLKESDDDGLFSAERRHKGKVSVEEKKEEALNLTVQIPGNGNAKIVIDLTTDNLADLLKNAGITGLILPAVTASVGETAAHDVPISTDTTLIKNKPKGKGFVNLPYELRSKVYKTLFKFDLPIELGKSDHIASAQFLRTCKLIEREGTEILYGENSFHFSRDIRVRGAYFERTWREVAYKDTRRFLEDIGPINIGNLKHLSFQLTDATDNRTRVAPGQITVRRFVDDSHVHQIFRLIGANAILKTLALQFGGRAMVTSADRSFLRVVSEVKSYNIVTIVRLFGHSHRCEISLMGRMKNLMWVRDEDGNRAKLDKVKYPVKMIYSEGVPGAWAVAYE